MYFWLVLINVSVLQGFLQCNEQEIYIPLLSFSLFREQLSALMEELMYWFAVKWNDISKWNFNLKYVCKVLRKTDGQTCKACRIRALNIQLWSYCAIVPSIVSFPRLTRARPAFRPLPRKPNDVIGSGFGEALVVSVPATLESNTFLSVFLGFFLLEVIFSNSISVADL